jgi:DNA-binding NtrC family response regulator
MSLRMQAMLLRFLETGEIQRVGSDRRLPVLDVRVITATHRPLLELVASKAFREDLYYRLNVIRIEVPALRERREDIPALVEQFVQDAAVTHRLPFVPEVAPEALDHLVHYGWPGNVRELKNVVERMVLRCRGERIDASALPADVTDTRNQAVRTGPAARTLRLSIPVELDESTAPIHEVLFHRIVVGQESFWTVVYEPFMARDLTRNDVREVIRLGLQHTLGNYKLLVASFNMPPKDYKRFLNFLRKYGCHVPFQLFRTVPTDRQAPEPPVAAIA